MNRRRAITTIESLMAMLIMAAAVTAVSQLTIAVAQQQRIARQRFAAMQEAANLMEQLLGQPLGAEQPGRDVELSPAVRQVLPQSTASVEVTRQEQDAGAGEHVVVTINWRQVVDGPEQNIRLAGWRYRSGEDSP